MSYYIALDPDLNVDVQDFVAAWNATPACRDLAEAQLVEMTPKGFPLDPQLAQQGLILLAGAAGGFAAGASTLVLESLKDALKDKLTEYFKAKLGPKPAAVPKVEFVRQPDGGLLIVTGDAG